MMGLSRVAAILALTATVAAAQPKNLMPPTAAQKADIERLAKQGLAKSQKGDHEGAIKDYLDAYAIHTSASVLLSNVGHEYRELKKPYEALKYFCMYLEKEPTGAAASYVLSEASAIWKELGNKEGEVCVKKPEPPVEKQPDPIVEQPKPPPPPPPKSSGGGGMKMAGLGIAGAGVIALGAGFFFGSKAGSKSDEISKGPPLDGSGNQVDWGPHPELGWDGIAKLEADGEKYEKFQIGLTVVGGAMVIGGTALYFLGRSKSTESNVTASVTKDGGGVVFSGRW
jgi:hypothetical protein